MEEVKTNERVISGIGQVLCDAKRPMKERFRALFTLRNIGGENCVRWIEKSFVDDSVLLKHECAYCLGQMQDVRAVSKLESILQDEYEDPIVRHEAGEALAAIGKQTSLNLLKQYSQDPVQVVAETCQLAVEKLKLDHVNEAVLSSSSPYSSVDPAPPLKESKTINELEDILLDENNSLFERYRAMFSLRNLGSTASVLSLAKGLQCKSALFRHEIAYVLGQIQDSACERHLTDKLGDKTEHEMVRHECAEALGAIATPSCYVTLNQFLYDEKRVVRESCEVALDMCDYENSTEFQYANTLLSASD